MGTYGPPEENLKRQTVCLGERHGIVHLTGKGKERQNVEQLELVARVHKHNEAFEYL